MTQHEVFPSILDNDLYKFTMQNAVFMHYEKKDIPVVYQFTNREKDLSLNKEAVEWLQKQINGKNNEVFLDIKLIFICRFRTCSIN